MFSISKSSILLLICLGIFQSVAKRPPLDEIFNISEPEYLIYKKIVKVLGKNGDYEAIVNDVYLQEAMAREEITHLGGPMLGHVTSESIKLWLRTSKPSEVTVLVFNDSLNFSKVCGPVYTSVDTQLVAVVELSMLKPETKYRYKVFVDNSSVQLPTGASFETPSTDGGNLARIAFGADSHVW